MTGSLKSRVIFYPAAMKLAGSLVGQDQQCTTDHQAGCNVKGDILFTRDVLHHSGDAWEYESAHTPGRKHHTVVETK